MTDVAEVLAAHDAARVLTAQDPDTWRCACGWTGSGRNHVAHVASHLQPLIDAEKQQAVEEALDEVRAMADGWAAVRDGVLSPGLRKAADQLRAPGIVQNPGGRIMGVDHDYAVGGPHDTPLREASRPASTGSES